MFNYIAEIIASHIKESSECKGCISYQEQIKYLKAQIEDYKSHWKDERAEYKRTVDRLLESSGQHSVGQGEHVQETNNLDLSLINLFKEKEDSGHSE